MLAARSTDGGATWFYPDPSDKTIVDGDAGQGPTACCDPTLAWDTFGNLFITYLGSGASVQDHPEHGRRGHLLEPGHVHG
jgi:hypothetical protein